MPELPPIREDATLDASEFVAALAAIAAEADKAAAAEAKMLAALKATQDFLDGVAGAAAAAAEAENRLAEAAAGVTGAEDAAAEASARLMEANAEAAGGIGALSGQMDSLIGHTEAVKGALDSLAEGTAADSAVMIAALNRIDAALGDMAADAAMDSAVTIAALGRAGDAAMDMAAKTVAASTVAGAAAGTAFRPWFLFGNNWRTALHWIVAGSAEFLAVAVPAAIALGAGLVVAAQGAQNAYEHFSALYDATESTYSAFGQTVGTTLGLGHALQTAQNAANPGVYELLGSAVNDARGSFQSLAGVGLDVVHMFDEFAARVTVDLQGGLGTEIQGLLSGMVTDLQEFGNVLGNLGHALLNFAADMPGLAHVLLTVATGISEVIEWASRAGPLLTFAMGLEEMYRWGGLAASMLARILGQTAAMNALGEGGFIFRFGAALQALVGAGGIAVQWIGSVISKLGGIVPGAEDAGAAIETLGFDMKIAVTMSPLMTAGIVGIAGAMVGLILVASHLKDALQQVAANAVKAVQSAGDLQVFNTATDQLAKLATNVTAVSGSMTHMSSTALEARAVANSSWSQWSPLISGLGGAGRLTASWSQTLQGAGTELQHMSPGVDSFAGSILHLFGVFSGATGATSDMGALNHAVGSIAATIDTVHGNLGLLASAFHTSQAGALALANAAGVNLQIGLTRGSTALKIAEQQIDNLKTGLGAMSAPAGEIGADMEAVGIQSQLASSKVGTVNSALDAFIAGTTGGMNAIMQFNAGLHAMGSDTASTSQSVTGAISSISRSAASMGYTLQGIGPHAQQSWQQFDAAVVQGNSVLDTFRTGMAEGVVSQQQYANEIKAVGGALLPFAAHNKTALSIVSQLAQEMGDPATHNLRTLASQFGITGKAAQEASTGGMERLIARMADMSTVARNLSATVSGQLDSAMAGAIVKASGLASAYMKWADDVKNNAPAATLKTDLEGIQKAQDFVNTAEQKGTTLLNNSAKAAEGVGSALKGAGGDAEGFGGALEKTHGALSDVVARANQAAQNTQSFGQQAHTAAGSASGLASQASTATAQVRNLGTASGITQGHLGDVNNEIRTTGTAAGNSAGPLGGMTGNIRNVGSAASTAAGQVHALALAIDGLQSKSITVTTNVVTVTSTIHRAMGGPVFPGVPTVVGEAGREMYVPAVPGYIFNHAQTEQMMAGAGTKGGAAAAPAGPIHVEATIPVTVTMDGKQVFQAVQRQSWQWSTRNTGRPGSWVPSP